MRRVALFAFALVAVTACAVPQPKTLDCGEDQSIFACKAKFTDGKSRGIVFVKFPMENQSVLDAVSTRDDLGNVYCVTLYANATATYAGGECGDTPPIASSPIEPTSTSVDPSARPFGLACVPNTPVRDCRAEFSDGTVRRVYFVEAPAEEAQKLDSDPHVDEAGVGYCVTLYDDKSATFRLGTDRC